MIGDEFNHYMRRSAIDLAILTGKPGRTLCGDRFAPELRVGSSGGADDPSLPVCPECQRIYEGLEPGRTEEKSSPLWDEASIDEALRELVGECERANAAEVAG